MQKILFLAAWYPTRFDAMAGLFVKRHAEVVAQKHNVAILHITPDSSNRRIIETEVRKEEGVFTVLVYYKKVTANFFLISTLLKVCYNLLAFFRGLKLVFRLWGRPDILHVHVLTLRLGLVSYFLSRWLRVPYFITEHSSNFLPEKNISRNILWTAITRWVIHKSQGVSAVSERLKEAMQAKKYTNGHFVVIRNVVPDIFFQCNPEFRQKDKIIFSNITCFDDYVKNISGIVRTVARLKEVRSDFQLRLIGTGPDKLKIERMVEAFNLSDCVYFTGLLYDSQLVDEIVLSDFTVLFSHYETMAVVIAESLACGRPVVATRTGGIPELINPTNGVLVEPANEDELLRQLLRMMDTYSNYNPYEIRREAISKFSVSSIAEAFDNFYAKSSSR